MIEHENLDVRTITLGISLLDCIDSDLGRAEPEDLREDYRDGEGSCRCRSWILRRNLGFRL